MEKINFVAMGLLLVYAWHTCCFSRNLSISLERKVVPIKRPLRLQYPSYTCYFGGAWDAILMSTCRT